MAYPVHNPAPRVSYHSLQHESELVVAIFRATLIMLAALSSLLGGIEAQYVTPMRVSVVVAIGYTGLVFLAHWLRWRIRGQRLVMAAIDLALVATWVFLTWRTGLRGDGSPLFPFFYVLIIVNALWFGVAGAIVSAAAIATAYLSIAYFASGMDVSVLVEALYRHVMYLFLVAIVTGYLVDTHKREREMWARSQVLLAQYQERFRAAQEVYELLIPATTPTVPGLDLGARWRPALQEGAGDFYDAIDIGEGRVAVIIADVAGKSMRGAIKLPLLKAAFLACAQVWSDPGEILSQVNRIVYPVLQPDMFISACMVVLDLPRRQLAYANGGQDPPLFVHADSGEPEWLTTGGLVLGIDARARYTTATVALEPGDTLCLYTDGVTEARNPAGGEFGSELLEARVRAGVGVGLTAQAIADNLFEAVNTHVSGAPRHDDITLVVARATAEAPQA